MYIVHVYIPSRLQSVFADVLLHVYPTMYMYMDVRTLIPLWMKPFLLCSDLK